MPSIFSNLPSTHLDLVGEQPAHVAGFVAEEALGVDAEDALAAFLVGGRHAVDHRPLRPGVVRSTRVGRAREDLELVDSRRALPVHGAEAVGAGVAATDDHHLLAARGDRRLVDVALLHSIRKRQELHRLMDASELAPGDRQVAPRRRTRGEHDRVELLVELVDRDVDADLDSGTELGALGPHLLEPALEVPLLHLELGDAVAEQPADAIGALEHDHVGARRG